jgi:hypothetical protein
MVILVKNAICWCSYKSVCHFILALILKMWSTYGCVIISPTIWLKSIAYKVLTKFYRNLKKQIKQVIFVSNRSIYVTFLSYCCQVLQLKNFFSEEISIKKVLATKNRHKKQTGVQTWTPTFTIRYQVQGP